MRGPSKSRTDLIVHSTHPFNAEPPLAVLRSSFVTPTESCYIRSHGDIPRIDAMKYRLRVTGEVKQPLELSVADLQARFEARSILAVMQCAGNRRADLQRVAPTTGDPWASGAIANVRWTGASLAEVLRSAGSSGDKTLHVAFEALDIAENEGARDAPYAVSIPMPKAVSGDVLLAWAMNDEPLTAEHGAPLRVVVPGYAGVRSPKWIGEIRVQDNPSKAFQQQRDYLLFPPDMTKETLDLSRGTAINEMPLNAAICEPEDGATLTAGTVTIRGYAIATDRAITRIDVSADGGRCWHQAVIEDQDNQRWSWTFWRAVLEIAKGEHELVVRAWDAAGQTQPANPADTWNFKGYLSAAWHRIRIKAE